MVNVASAYIFEALKKGSEGSAVELLQTRLKNFGFYRGSIDGNFGSQTEAAVKEFQKNNAAMFDPLNVDGVVGYETEAMIERNVWLSERPTLEQGSKGEEVKRLQSLLLKFSELSPTYNADIGSTTPDGNFGPKTKNAVIEYQKFHQIEANGIANSDVWKLLSYVLTDRLKAEQIVLTSAFELIA